uniref:Uncharacterized protein n=1 Tax=Rhizophora mucronata TaxID=61149 RepID=A0A2P2QC20_RHIMU
MEAVYNNIAKGGIKDKGMHLSTFSMSWLHALLSFILLKGTKVSPFSNVHIRIIV